MDIYLLSDQRPSMFVWSAIKAKSKEVLFFKYLWSNKNSCMYMFWLYFVWIYFIDEEHYFHSCEKEIQCCFCLISHWETSFNFHFSLCYCSWMIWIHLDQIDEINCAETKAHLEYISCIYLVNFIWNKGISLILKC